jgi:uncharacterized protein (TIGR03437 family)
MHLKLAVILILSEAALLAPHLGAQTGSSGIVISQVYGGGGNSGATLKNDFIELFNRSDKAITVTGWSVQYASAAGTSWDHTSLSGTIQPGQYYLVQEATGNAGTTSLPTPDASGGLALSATDGKVALVNNSILLTGAASTGSSIVDFVGYGTANASEGSAAGALNNTTAAIRSGGGCTDTNNNRSDFSIGAPNPRNSHSALNPCSTPPPPPPSKPDLLLTSLSAPKSGTAGGTLSGTSATVKNQGAAASAAFRIGFYLSPSATMTVSTVFTGTSCAISTGLAAGATFTCNGTVVIPSTLAAGNWFLLGVADDQNQIDESDETNNLRISDSGVVSITGASNPGPSCGEERWSVKTGTDADVKLVDLNDVSPTTIATLTALAAPATKPENNRVQPTETTVFLLNATLTQYTREDDSDYHLDLQDAAGKTMIAEIPLPSCIGPGSPFLNSITTARSKFDSRFTATTSFNTANIPVQIKGVGFFDFLHGQTGVAPNGIEIHPVLDITFNPLPTITSVNTASGPTDIAQNDYIEIHGVGLAPPSVAPNGMVWDSAPEFLQGKMPTLLSNVSAKVNNKPAYIYYINETQINVLTPLDNSQGPVSTVVTNGGTASSAFTANLRGAVPTFLRFGSTNYIAARHANGALLGPTSMSVPGYTFTPAQPGEIVLLYGVGFGLTNEAIVEGSSSQFGNLPTLPIIQIGGTTASVQFAGLSEPGLYQFNVVIPQTATNGDNSVTATYAGSTTAAGTVIAVQR